MPPNKLLSYPQDNPVNQITVHLRYFNAEIKSHDIQCYVNK